MRLHPLLAIGSDRGNLATSGFNTSEPQAVSKSSDPRIRAEPFMPFKRLRAFTATALISFSSANNRRRPEPLAQVNDESDAPKITLTPSKDLSPAPIRLALSCLYTSHIGSRSSATVGRIVMQG